MKYFCTFFEIEVLQIFSATAINGMNVKVLKDMQAVYATMNGK